MNSEGKNHLGMQVLKQLRFILTEIISSCATPKVLWIPLVLERQRILHIKGHKQCIQGEIYTMRLCTYILKIAGDSQMRI